MLWQDAFKKLIKKYKGRKHPLDYKNKYQLFVMVVLSARTTDALINNLAKELFKAFPNMESLSSATPEMLYPYVGKVTNFRHKSEWLIAAAKQIKKNSKIPMTMDALTALPGIGRKSANVIMREAKAPAEGVMVDLHVARVAQRLGIASSPDPEKIEEAIMESLPRNFWADAGMSLSYLGREVCRPADPKHAECVMNTVCAYYKSLKGGRSARKKSS